MKLTPLNKNLIIEPRESAKVTQSGIILKSSIEADRAYVLEVGPNVENINKGDIVMVDWNKTTKIKEKTYLISELDVIGVFE